MYFSKIRYASPTWPLPSLTSRLEPLPLDVVAGPRLRVDHVEAALPGGPVGHPPNDAVGVEHLVGAGDDALLVGGLVAGVRQPRVLVIDGVGKGVGLPHGGLQIGNMQLQVPLFQ